MKSGIWTLCCAIFLLGGCVSHDKQVAFSYQQDAHDLGDDDGDGVVNARDMCGGTTAGIKVAHDGCAFWEQVEEVKEAVVLFDTGSDQVRVEHIQAIQDVVAYVASHDDAYILVEGHSSAIGDEEFNRELQKRRSASVRELLVQEGAAPDKIRIHDQGSVSQRVSDEESAVAHAVNQRAFIRAVRAEQSMQKKWTIYSSEQE